MSKKMLIDAVHEEETRIAVVDENKLIDYDYESKVRKQLKGSVFLAKVTRVEPSLQAAFVDYGGNRHGFLPFSEIHPDYYRIPIADRQKLLEQQERELEEKVKQEEEEEKKSSNTAEEDLVDEDDNDDEDEVEEIGGDTAVANDEDDGEAEGESAEGESDKDDGKNKKGRRNGRRRRGRNKAAQSKRVETVGGDSNEGEVPLKGSLWRNYKIQEVVKRGQIMLIQVSREERGTKGAAVTTYISLPGRYCVLMPNSPKSGGVSRKIDNYKDRRKMRDILKDLEVPKGMSCIIRTAGVQRNKTDIKRDMDYLTRLWNSIRETTLSSTAPALIHEEGNLIRRSIRDIYTRDIQDIYVAGENGYKKAKEFMKMMIPSHARRVKLYKENQIPLFQRYQVESQIQEMGEPQVTLQSGGYLVINPTEALVSIDVNSGRATKGRHIEETALKTNLEAAEEVARQLRLRDLGGLVVIDFIDMEDRRNNRKVENRLKGALSVDRARIQVGRISTFGLLELSRQRLNPSLTEAQFKTCDHCKGNGIVRTIDSAAIMALRALEEEGVKDRAARISLTVPNNIALYILNNKRDMLEEIESRYGFEIVFVVDEKFAPSGYKVEVLESSASSSQPQQKEQAKEEEREEASEDEQKRGTRRRGKRGGRNRRRGERRKDEASDSKAGSSEEGAAEETKDKEAEKKKAGASESVADKEKNKSGRKRGGKRATTKAKEKEESKAPEADVKPKDAPKEAKEKKPSTNRKKEASGSKVQGDKPVIATEPAPSNDSVPQREYETVNEKPKKKKTGWWSKPDK